MPFGLDFFHDSEIQVNLFFSRCSRSSFCALARFWAKASAKVRKILIPSKHLSKKVSKNMKVFGIDYNCILYHKYNKIELFVNLIDLVGVRFKSITNERTWIIAIWHVKNRIFIIAKLFISIYFLHI